MRYQHIEIASIGILLIVLDKLFVTIVSDIYTREQFDPTPASSLLTLFCVYELLEFAAVGVFVVVLDKFLEAWFPEYRLHKRILSITAIATNTTNANDTNDTISDDGSKRKHNSDKHKPTKKQKQQQRKRNTSSLTLCHSHNIGGSNGFQLIADLLCNPNRHLSELRLTHDCGITAETATILSEGLSSPHNRCCLEHLDIGYNSQTLTVDVLRIILDALSLSCSGGMTTSSSSLRNLQLNGNRIDSAGAELIGGILTGGCCGNIESLNLRDNMMGDEGIPFIADALSSTSSSSSSSSRIKTKLTHLDVGWNRIRETGIKALCEMLQTNDTLQCLSLENNVVNEEASKCLADVLKKNTTLRSLNLKETYITVPGAQSLASGLSTNSTLKELDLSCNRSMGEDGVEAIAKSLSTNNTNDDDDSDGNNTITNLQILKLDGNRVRLQATEALHTMITSNSTLIQLHLRSCFITDEGAGRIADALAPSSSGGGGGGGGSCCSLKILNLQGNRIGQVGASHLSNALTTNRSLTMLNLAKNSPWGVRGVLEFAKGLIGNSTLQVLNLAHNFDCQSLRNDGDDEGGGGRGCMVATQALRKVLFFPPRSKDDRDNDDDDDGNAKSALPTYHFDINDLQVGWSLNQHNTYPPLDVCYPAPYHRHNNSNSSTTTIQSCPCQNYRTSSIYGWATYAKRKDKNGHFPLQYAIQSNLKWRDGLPKLLEANYLAMKQENEQTGLLPFMTAAVGDGSDWELVYQLLQQNPGCLVSYVVSR